MARSASSSASSAAPTTRWLAIPALIAAAYGAGLLYELAQAPTGCCNLTWPSPDGYQAERLMLQTDPKGNNAAVETQVSREVLRARPSEPTAWLRLAYTDFLAHGLLTPEGLHDLDTSYLVAPYGGDWAPWRITFALINWRTLQPATRRAVAAEADVALDDTQTGIPQETKARAMTVADPVGKLAAALMGITAPQIRRPHRAHQFNK